MDNFPVALAEALERGGKSQRAICRETGLSRSTLRRWLAGKQVPYEGKVRRIADLLEEPGLVHVIGNRQVRPKVTIDQHPFLLVFNQARARKGLTVEETCRKASLSPSCLQDWTRRKAPTVPYSDSIERLATVLDAPELLDLRLLPFKWRRYKVTCTICSVTRLLKPSQYENHVSTGVLDTATGMGTWTCSKCQRHRKRVPLH